jgi:protein phosphatase inhibitor 2
MGDFCFVISRLKAAAERRSSAEFAGGFDEDDDDEEDDTDLTDAQKLHKKEFQNRRKAHYNEFEAVRLARKLIEEEDEDEDDDGGKETSKAAPNQTMDVEETSGSPKGDADAGGSSSAK